MTSRHPALTLAAAACALWVGASSEAAAQKKDGTIWKEPGGAKPKVEVPSLAPLGESLKPTVVSVLVTQVVDPAKLDPMFELFEEFLGPLPETFVNKGMGSGVIINEKGYILTNHHVVADTQSIVVTLDSGREYPAIVVGSDAATDIAVIKIEAEDLPVAVLGDSDATRVGDWVLAIGSPFGLEASMSAGIVSAKGRHDVSPGDGHAYQDFIQTDAPINPGSSGGPLFDLSGHVVGINTAISAAGQGIGFAIPINMVKKLIPHLVEFGQVHRSWLGVTIQRLTADLLEGLGLPPDTLGALVSDVEEGSPASEAGIQPGDVVIRFDGQPVSGIDALSWLAAVTGEGEKVAVVLLRSGKKKTVNVKLAAMPGTQPAPAVPHDPAGEIVAETAAPDPGITLEPIDSGTAAQLGIEKTEKGWPGLLVTAIETDSPLAGKGLYSGDVILEVNGEPAFHEDQVLDPIVASEEGEGLLLWTQSPVGKRFVAWSP